ncbi:hypothetical protein [Sorangium sp. So ce124]|uniref:hypothetical protein n=1 Tax=Sorangium sp. So ce124 TaxID=3133280 RepID=UPI003F6171CF
MTAQAAISISVVEATDGQFVQGNLLTVHVIPEGDATPSLVTAEYGGMAIELAPAASGSYEGTFDISEVAYGPHPLTVSVFDPSGGEETAQTIVHKYAPPTAWLSMPRPSSVLGPAPIFDARCTPTPPYDCTDVCVTLSVMGETKGQRCSHREPGESPAPLALYWYFPWRQDPTTPLLSEGDVVTITVSARAGLQGSASPGPEVKEEVGPMYVETSSKLTSAQSVPGAILDFDATRILFAHHLGPVGVMSRATQEVTWLSTLPRDPAGTVTTYGALTPSGAVVQSSSGRIFKWVDGQWTRIVQSGRLDAVNGDKLVWTWEDDDRGYVHVLSTGVNTPIWNRPGSTSPFQTDITPSGDVYYSSYEEPWIRHLMTARIGNHPGQLQRPISDGVNVAGEWWDGTTSSSYLFTATGEEVFLGDSISGSSGGLLLHAGYTGFLMSDGAVNQVWLRTPDGEPHQISDFASSSSFDQQKLHVGHDGISDSGEVVFLNGRKRHIGGPGLEPEAVSSDLGHARWIDGSLQLSIGNTLFQVERASAADAGEPPIAALRAAPEGLDAHDRSAGGPLDAEALGALDLTTRQLALHEPVVPSEQDGADDAAFGARGERIPAGLGCSAGTAGSSGGATALVMALAGLALGRRGRRRS